MEMGRFTFLKKLTGGLAIFAAGGFSGYFFTGFTMDNSAASSDVVMICHKEDGRSKTMLIPATALDAHMAHGDNIGSCIEQGGDVVIEHRLH
jgi:hypothetical protein